MQDFWTDVKTNQLTSIYRNIRQGTSVPTQESIAATTRSTPIDCDCAASFTQSSNQSLASYNEQLFAIKTTTRTVDKYREQFGSAATTYTKSPIIHGAPGS